ncbi:MAG: helix-turn-helix domain-containing protein [Pseudomonadales bacterium]
MSLKQIDDLLGYSDLSAFYNAFRRWTGSSPSECRHKA